MVAPERDTPGIMARHCAETDQKGQRQGIVHDAVIALLDAHPVDGKQDHATHDQGGADEPGRGEQIGLDVLVGGGADHRRRQECHDDGDEEVPRRGSLARFKASRSSLEA